jgi:hypothetical protein
MTIKLMILIAFAGLAGTRIQLDERASVVFPETPRKKQAGGQVFYTATTKQYVHYAAFADIDPDVSSADEQVIQAKAYQTYIQGIFATADIERLVEEKDFQVNRHNGKQIVYLKNFGNRRNVKVVARIVLIGKRMYQFEVWGLEGEVDKKTAMKFFDSVEINN